MKYSKAGIGWLVALAVGVSSAVAGDWAYTFQVETCGGGTVYGTFTVNLDPDADYDATPYPDGTWFPLSVNGAGWESGILQIFGDSGSPWWYVGIYGASGAAAYTASAYLPAHSGPWTGQEIVTAVGLVPCHTGVRFIGGTPLGEAPDCTTARPSLAQLWPPNHQMVAVTIEDVGTGGLPTQIVVTEVRQDEPANGLGDGDTPCDAVFTADSDTVLLRAERAGKGNGRVYHVSFTAINALGSCIGEVTVNVPPDRKPGRPCLDDGPDFPSCP